MGHDKPAPEEWLTVDQLADQYDLGRSTVWLYLRRYHIPRYRMAARGKTTLIRRQDWERALHTPVPVRPPLTPSLASTAQKRSYEE
jgi:hypothetical protein